MADDNIEYETEPHPDFQIDGKPVYYAKNVPDLLRGDLTLSPMKLRYAQALDKMVPLDRAARGRRGWNLWVKAYHTRWLVQTEKGGRIYFAMKSPAGFPRGDDAYFEKNGIDFKVGQTLDSDGRYEIAVEDFSNFIFPCVVSFQGARFSGDAGFTEAYFGGDAGFKEAHFGGDARFNGARFSGDARFNGARFGGDAWFNGARFGGDAWFNGAHFSGFARFNGARFGGDARFNGARFGGDARFNGARFQKACSFQRAVYFRGARWNDTTFTTSVDFSQTQFLHSADFKNAKFKAHADFDHAWFGKTSDTPPPDKKDEWPAELTAQYAQASVDASSETVPNFNGAIFEIAPNLGFTHVAPLPAPVAPNRWQAIKRFWGFGLKAKDSKITDENAGSKLRRMQELAAAGHHHLAEKRFFRAELLARRGHEAVKWQEIAMINLFELFSQCGLSFWRPMRWLLGVVTVSFLFYLFMLDTAYTNLTLDKIIVLASVLVLCLWYPKRFIVLLLALFAAFHWSFRDWVFSSITPEMLGELASYSIANSLPLLGYISDSYSVSVQALFGGIENVPGWVRVYAFMQNAVSAIFIFFGLLAIRNYFKLG